MTQIQKIKRKLILKPSRLSGLQSLRSVNCQSIEPAHKLKIDQNKLQNCRSNILNLVNVL
ncbi:hypothetical protein D1AOALGA4SA_8666 [Olavius algarvensis Delta 1 endosymbiont]|nr:hypothetical protein D1AOALGA4SA_8666 [Olavius algarvensis Delta 1 endosymbiont]